MNLYLDIAGGISGDMFMATLLGLGADFSTFQEKMNTLPIADEFEIMLDRVMKGSISGLQAQVQLNYHGDKNDPSHENNHDYHHEQHDNHHDDQDRHCKEHHHRGLKEVLAIIEASQISEKSKRLAYIVFRELAEAEAYVHGTTVEEVHFHEVGAVDSIVDIVGVCLLVDQLGIDKVYYNSLPLGGGQVQTAHGLMPIPAPATSKLMEKMQVRPSPAEGEQVTPTGVALLKGLGAEVLSEESIRIEKTAIGCGQKNFSFPNILRGALFKDKHRKFDKLRKESLITLSCNIDDMTGEFMAQAVEDLMKAGALDVWIVPIIMKKGRPAYTLKVLINQDRYEGIIDKIFDCTTTLGIRVLSHERISLDRKIVTRKTPYGEIRFKETVTPQGKVRSKPEFDSLKEKAETNHSTSLQWSDLLSVEQDKQ